MITAAKVMAPVDFSDLSSYALEYAWAFLAELGMKELHLVHADVLHADPVSFDEMYGMPMLSADDEAKRGTFLQRELDQIAKQYREDLVVKRELIRDISVAPALLRYARKNDIDLIVMGTHGRRGIRRWLLGSVAEEMVQLAECSILTVRAPEDPVHKNIQRILVPVDFSKYAREALVYAKFISGATDAPVTLFHVVQDQFHPAFYTPVVQSIYDLNPRIEEEMIEKLKVFAAETAGPDVPFNVDVHYGHPAETIVREAEDIHSDLIVMATHGLTGLEHFFMGSVAEKVVRLAQCPVFTVKSFGKNLMTGSAVESLAQSTE